MTLRLGEWIVVAGVLLIGAFAALVATLIYLKPPPAMYGYAESAAANLGETIYKRESCRDCHQVFGNGSTSGPKLDGIGALRSDSMLKAYLLDPSPVVGDKIYRVKMPSYAHLNQDDRDALVAYLLALSPPAAQNAATPCAFRYSGTGSDPCK
jgi:cbb3-type cytochrome oxidase cytochrome c subunit